MRAHARRLLLLALASQLMTVEARSRLAKSRAKSVAEARAEAEELTAATKEAGMQHLSAAAAGKRKPCYSLKLGTTDEWCNENCHAGVRNCPSGVCKCGGPRPTAQRIARNSGSNPPSSAANHKPTTAAHVKTAQPSTQQKAKTAQPSTQQKAFWGPGKPIYCRSISKSSTSAWCQTNCHARERYCPTSLCLCDGKRPTHPPKHHSKPTHHSSSHHKSHHSRHHSSHHSAHHHTSHHSSGPRSPVPPKSFKAPTNTSQWGSPGGGNGKCAAMISISADQLQCTFPLLDAGRASYYAAAASAKLGSVLGTSCAWAAFLGNVAIETLELTIWKEINCATAAPWCGRGPLQLTSHNNYAFCARQPVCQCPHILSDRESSARKADVGFGTAACVWAALFGHSLTPLADGTRAGFLKTCCSIHQGHWPCSNMGQYSRREQYWRTASRCLGAPHSSAAELYLQPLKPGWSNPSYALLPEDITGGIEEGPPSRFVHSPPRAGRRNRTSFELL